MAASSACARSIRLRRFFAASMALLCAGCELLRRPSVQLVDPTIVAETRYESDSSSTEVRIGPYRFVHTSLRERGRTGQVVEGTGGTAGVGTSYELSTTMQVEQRAHPWTVRCEAVRTPSDAADFGAVASEPNDRVQIDCRLVYPDKVPWTFHLSGRIDQNMAGKIARTTTSDDNANLAVELILWSMRLQGMVRRPVPEPLVQVRNGRVAVAAMLMNAPQWTWVAAQQPQELRDVAVAVLGAISLMPLALEQ